MIQLAIHGAINGRDLDYTIAHATTGEMMDGCDRHQRIAALLTALRMKGRNHHRVTACAEVMREKGAHIRPKGAVMDIVGTGDGRVGSFNISRPPHLWRRRAACRWQKHGNRSVSSSRARRMCSRLGVVLSLSRSRTKKVAGETGICFLFAQGYHKSMKRGSSRP